MPSGLDPTVDMILIMLDNIHTYFVVNVYTVDCFDKFIYTLPITCLSYYNYDS